MLLEGQANPSAALALYENALAKEPSLILSRRAIAALKAMGDLSSVVEALNRHLDTFYTDPEAWLELAEIYATQGMYIQSAFALEEVILQVAQNSFYHLKYAETLYTAGEVAKSYKAFLRVLEMCQSDGEAVETKSVKAGPWLRALWGTKMATTALIWSSSPQKGTNAAKDDKEKVVDVDKVKKIDELVTSLLLNKVYTSQNVPAKHLRDLARSVLAA
nr:tpr-like protein [Melanopsichium pennsylvanicum 4]